MEPRQQMEIQLGHMCNNRCVFCVSGQRTALREAFPLAGDPIVQQLRQGFAQGMRKVTLLGGEPTIQPEFLRVVRAAVELGFEEIVIFTNGAKTARDSYIDEVLATGGRFTWRLSFQGANREAHERTTKKPGSFGRLVETLKNLHQRGERTTVNMCVVSSNFESVADFPALLLPHGVVQLHLDMIRPLDAGERTVEEMRAMLPRYSELVPYLERMVAGFPEGFDVNIGNLPYCVAPRLAPWIHHDGEKTLTIAIDHRDTLSNPWDKYEVKRRDKLKRESCRECVFDPQCSGIFETYREFYGMDELRPVLASQLPELDPDNRLLTLQLAPHLAALRAWTPPAPFSAPAMHVSSRDNEVVLGFDSPDGAVEVKLRPPSAGGFAATDRFSLSFEQGPAGARTGELLRALFDLLCAAAPAKVRHPLGPDATFLPWNPGAGAVDAALGRRLRQLRARAPFGELAWDSLALSDSGRSAELTLTHEGAAVVVVLAAGARGLSGSYRLVPADAAPTAELAEGVRQIFAVLRGPLGDVPSPPAPGPASALARSAARSLPVL